MVGAFVVATVALTPLQMATLQTLGVMDSKEPSLDRMKVLAKEIERESLAKRVVIIPPERFNEF